MVSFGLGTIPLMILAALSGSFISLRLRNLFKKIYPLSVVLRYKSKRISWL
jgi:sulfite exporter TauE/SafE